MPRVLNKKRFHIPGDSTYIGRGSKWGNPFVLGRDGDRETVVLAYFEHIKTKPDLLLALDELRGRDLLCFCAPELCHGDVLMALANMSEEQRACFLDIPLDEYPRAA